MKRWQIYAEAISETGLCKKSNQDRFLAQIGEGPEGDFGLFLIADGMGSETGGETAAELAVESARHWWKHALPRIMSADSRLVCARVKESLEGLIHHIHEAIIALGERIGSNPGTTLSILFLYGGGYIILHVGDSRIYSRTIQLEQLTTDHTVVAEQVRDGRLNPVQAETHPQRHVLTQCVGLKRGIYIEILEGNWVGRAGFLLCSDGFYNQLNTIEIDGLWASGALKPERLRRRVDQIFSRGAFDNLTAVLISIEKVPCSEEVERYAQAD